jgi:nitrous oxide reductase accessory protein NosL
MPKAKDTKPKDPKAPAAKGKKVLGAAPAIKVFYKELTSTGRDGAVASRSFDNEKDAKAFAAKVDGKVK